MNEQIKQLMLEARLGPALLLHHWGKIDALTDSEQAELERLEKFAELLIRECAQFTDYGIRKFILNHFEIKE
jgi:hypothetical protein